MQTFHTPEPVRLRISVSSGTVRVTATQTSESTVELDASGDDEVSRDLIAQTKVDQHGDEISIVAPRRFFVLFGRRPHLDVAVTVPTGSALAIRTESADVEARGDFGETSIETGSGDVRLDTVTAEARIKTGSGEAFVGQVDGSLRVESGSGDLELRRVAGDATISTGSGDIEVESVQGELRVNSGSGDIEVRDAQSSVVANSASGDLQLLCVRSGQVRVSTASGDVHIGVADGTPVWLDVTTLSGDVHSSLDGSPEPTDDEDSVALRVNTASGDITLVHA
jgi:DUF4097 and DUF4098 domain-containing protein YvlB